MHPPPYNPNHLLSDWPECFLEIRCGCGRSCPTPVKMLLREIGDHPFKDVLPRLRCKTCGRGGAPVYLVAGHTRKFCGGGEADWAIEVVHAPDWKRETREELPQPAEVFKIA